MTMRVTMLNTRMGESGSLLSSGSTYSVSDGFGAALVGAGNATDTDGVLTPPYSQPVQYSVDTAGNVSGLVGPDGGRVMSLTKTGERSPCVNFGGVFSLSDVAVVAGSPTLSVVTGPNGSQALKIVTPVGGTVEITFPSLVGAAFDGETYLSVSGGKAEGVLTISLYATPDASYSTNFVAGTYFCPTGSANMAPEQGGAYTVRLGKSTLTTTGTIAYPFAVNAHKVRITPVGGLAATVYLYGIGFSNQPSNGRIAVICDDGYDSWFQLGQPIFNARNIPVTCAVIPTNIDTGYAGGNAFKRQLQGLVNKNGAVVAHGPNVGGGAGNLFSAFSDTSSRINDMVGVRNWIFENRLDTPGCEMCYVWPQGAFQPTFGDVDLLDAALAAGFTTSRNANGLANGLFCNFDAQSKYGHLCLPIIGHTWAGSTASEVTNIAAITAAINDAAAQGSDVVLMLHRVQPTSTVDGSMSSIGIRVSDLTTIADAIAAKVTAGTLVSYTFPQLAISNKSSFWTSQ